MFSSVLIVSYLIPMQICFGSPTIRHVEPLWLAQATLDLVRLIGFPSFRHKVKIEINHSLIYLGDEENKGRSTERRKQFIQNYVDGSQH